MKHIHEDTHAYDIRCQHIKYIILQTYILYTPIFAHERRAGTHTYTHYILCISMIYPTTLDEQHAVREIDRPHTLAAVQFLAPEA